MYKVREERIADKEKTDGKSKGKEGYRSKKERKEEERGTKEVFYKISITL